jgi:O-antigen/teichoic acid export membrane protein
VTARPPQPEPPAGDLVDSRAAGPVAARGGALRAGGYAVGTLLAVASAPLMIRHLGVEDYGRYVTVLSLVVIVAGFTDAGLNTIALREYATAAGSQRDGVMRDLLGIRIVLGVAGVLAAVGFALVAGYSRVLVVGTAAVGVGMLLQSVQTMLAVAMQGELRFGWITVVELLRQLLFVAFIVALVLAGAGLEPFFFVQVPAFVITFAMIAALVRGLMPLRPSFHPRRWWPLLRDTMTYAAAVALNSAYFRIAVVALSLLASERETGYFATAFRVIEVLIAVPALVIGAAFPILSRAARDDRERLDAAVSRLVEVALIMGVWFALGIALAAEPIIDVLTGSGSQPSVDLLRILSFALIATFVNVASGYALLSLRRHATLLYANIVALVASIVLALSLIPSYDATGAAVAVLLAELVLATFTLVALIRERPAVSAVLGRAPSILAAGVIAGLIGLLPGVPPLVHTALGLVAFPALLLALRRFPPEIADALRGRVRGEMAG